MVSKEELSPTQFQALNDLIGSAPFKQGEFPDRNTATSTPRHFEIPPSHYFLGPTREQVQQYVERQLREGLPTDRSLFDPVEEYNIYGALAELGLVAMTSEQGSNVTKVEITLEGASVLGRKLVGSGSD